jgi:soluble lytic murein transglycosylase
MTLKRLLSGSLALLLAACTFSPLSGIARTATPTLPPGVTPSATVSPTLTPSPTPVPQVRLKTGDEDLFRGDYDGAIAEYQTAFDSSSDPEIKANALWGLGRVYQALGNNPRALDFFVQLTTAYPSSIDAARAYFVMGDIYMSLERYTDAAQAFTQYAKLRPGVIDEYVQERLGDAYNAAGNYSEAITAYKTAVAAPHISDDTAIEIKIAKAYESSGDANTALSLLDTIASSSSNDFVKAQIDLLAGQLYLSLGQADPAYQRFNHAVDNYPTSYDSYSALVALVNANVTVDQMNRGLVDYFAGQYGYALDAFHNYINTNPNNDGTAYYYLAMTLREMGKYQEAVDAFSNFINKFNQNQYWQAAWDEKAFTQWYYLGDYAAAARTLIDYAAADPGSTYIPQTMLTAGQIYERAGKLNDAAQLWTSIADSYPASELVPQALFLAGIAHYRDAKYDQALISFQRDLLLSTAVDDQARASFWIGKTQQIMGDASSAKTTWQQTSTLDPTSYYSLRAQDMLFNRIPFATIPIINLNVDLATERKDAEAWMRVTFNLPADVDLSTPGSLLSDPRMVRGTELWILGLQDEARTEFEDLRTAVQNNATDTYRLMNYQLNLGLYRPAIFAARQVLTLAGMTTQAQTLAAPRYFNHIRYGLYYMDVIAPAAQQSGFDTLFLFSVIRQESLFEGFVRSTAGARGLMQILPSTGQDIANNFGWPPNFTPDDLYRPLVSVNLGAEYLMTNRNRLNGDLYTTLAAYNAGAVSEEVWRNLSGNDPDLFLEIIRFQETSNYIRSIYEIYGMYRTLYGITP